MASSQWPGWLGWPVAAASPQRAAGGGGSRGSWHQAWLQAQGEEWLPGSGRRSVPAESSRGRHGSACSEPPSCGPLPSLSSRSQRPGVRAEDEERAQTDLPRRAARTCGTDGAGGGARPTPLGSGQPCAPRARRGGTGGAAASQPHLTLAEARAGGRRRGPSGSRARRRCHRVGAAGLRLRSAHPCSTYRRCCDSGLGADTPVEIQGQVSPRMAVREAPRISDPMASWTGSWWLLRWMIFVFPGLLQATAEKSPGAYFLPEFALSPQGSFLEDTTGEQFLTYRYDDQTSRNTHSDEDKDGNWDAWGEWSDCSRTCGGGASYSLRRCLTGRNCEGQNIRYKTCSNHDCPADSEDFRAQQCSAYNDVQYQGHYYEWIPLYNDPAAPCALKCHAQGQSLVVELAPKVLDGTRCNADSLDMCISGICQAVGCDRQLGSSAKEDNCGVCAGDGSTCRLVRGQAKIHLAPEKREENVIAVPLGSRSVRITVKGPARLFIESKTLQGNRGEHSFNSPGVFVVENTTIEFQKGADRQTFKIPGPMMADFIFKTRYTVAKGSVVQFFFYQPISHQWRQTDFFPCTVTCGGGYQLNSAECMDIRLKRVVPDHYCHYYPENVKPKPKLKECSMDPCPSSDGFKEIMPYDHFQPLPRWEHNPWTACSVSCGGGIQRRSFVCVEESMHAEILQVEEWKCMYAPKPKVMQTCNLFDCPKWVAMEWSQCTVTCGRGLRYRVVLCINHRGQHVGGCNPQMKLHIKEECVIPIPCYKPKEKSPVEAKLPWLKQAQELEETRIATEEPKFIPEPWSACSTTCGPGIQVREVRCRVLLTFTQTETELPEEECEGPKLPTERPCLLEACDQSPVSPELGGPLQEKDSEMIYDWEYAGFTPCTATCLGGHQEAIAVCLHIQTQQTVNDSLCDMVHRPPAMSQACNMEPCPPRWHVGSWGPCSATCGVGIQTRDVYCLHPEDSPAPLEECRDDKPHALRACNQFDCPPSWHIEEWQQCSRTCGGGTQNRRVTCRQLLTDGSFLNLSDELCQGPKASSHKSCARTDCPPQLTAGDWSKGFKAHSQMEPKLDTAKVAKKLKLGRCLTQPLSEKLLLAVDGN